MGYFLQGLPPPQALFDQLARAVAPRVSLKFFLCVKGERSDKKPDLLLIFFFAISRVEWDGEFFGAISAIDDTCKSTPRLLLVSECVLLRQTTEKFHGCVVCCGPWSERSHSLFVHPIICARFSVSLQGDRCLSSCTLWTNLALSPRPRPFSSCLSLFGQSKIIDTKEKAVSG